MLRVKKLTVKYGPLIAINGISLEIKKGDIVSLIGPNKAGKTTFLLTLSGILETTEGRIYFEGEDITNLAPYKIVSKGVGHVPQGRHTFPTLSVIDNLMMGTYAKQKVKKELKGDLDWIYQLFPVLKERNLQRAGTLSGGEQQMLAIGRALMGRPKFLMLDEPSSGLAPRFIHDIFGGFKEMNQKGLTLLIVEQEVDRVLSISHYGYLMRNGRFIKEGPASQLKESQEVRAIMV